jgi:uncharacterized protein (DUF952 family)
MTENILHATSAAAWAATQSQGAYTADSLASEGFIHCSRVSQILRVANTYFKGQHGMVLLVIDPARLKSEMRWEPGTDVQSELFPHIYGPLNLEAVMEVLDFEPQADGGFVLPDKLKISG